jgi:chromosome segregation ATPase
LLTLIFNRFPPHRQTIEREESDLDRCVAEIKALKETVKTSRAEAAEETAAALDAQKEEVDDLTADLKTKTAALTSSIGGVDRRCVMRLLL